MQTMGSMGDTGDALTAVGMDVCGTSNILLTHFLQEVGVQGCLCGRLAVENLKRLESGNRGYGFGNESIITGWWELSQTSEVRR